MKYSLLDIKRSNIDKKWYCTFSDIHGDREKREIVPNASLGFLHYPQNWSDEKALELLKSAMIKERKDLIKLLLEDINSIDKLTVKSTI